MLREHLDARARLPAGPRRADDVDDQHRAQPLPRLAAAAAAFEPLADGDGAITNSTESDGLSPLAELERARSAGAVARCLADLEARPAPGDRARLLRRALARGAGEPHARAAIGTVKTWVRRGLLKLENCLAEVALNCKNKPELRDRLAADTRSARCAGGRACACGAGCEDDPLSSPRGREWEAQPRRRLPQAVAPRSAPPARESVNGLENAPRSVSKARSARLWDPFSSGRPFGLWRAARAAACWSQSRCCHGLNRLRDTTPAAYIAAVERSRKQTTRYGRDRARTGQSRLCRQYRLIQPILVASDAASGCGRCRRDGRPNSLGVVDAEQRRPRRSPRARTGRSATCRRSPISLEPPRRLAHRGAHRSRCCTPGLVLNTGGLNDLGRSILTNALEEDAATASSSSTTKKSTRLLLARLFAKSSVPTCSSREPASRRCALPEPMSTTRSCSTS